MTIRNYNRYIKEDFRLDTGNLIRHRPAHAPVLQSEPESTQQDTLCHMITSNCDVDVYQRLNQTRTEYSSHKKCPEIHSLMLTLCVLLLSLAVFYVIPQPFQSLTLTMAFPPTRSLDINTWMPYAGERIGPLVPSRLRDALGSTPTDASHGLHHFTTEPCSRIQLSE